ncbi:unnamed protein product [Rotaria socialis]|uniref:Uncharacterized protein n=1 Tax=Rotaria socialis TaxID=392032 RepID=A0A820H2B4_9BILA|nr:unnamed protein product [Rotaria socialis]
MKRILLATNYPNLFALGLYDIEIETALSLVIDCSDLLDKWRPLAFQSVTKLSIDYDVWTSSLVRFPCEIQTPIDTIKLPLSISNTIQNKNVILVYSGSFSPIHLNHLEVMDFV